MKKEIVQFMYSHYGRTGLLIKKASPEIFIATGIVGGVTATVLACKATLKADAIMDEHKAKLEQVNTAATIDPEYAKGTEKGKDILITYTQTSFNFLKLYGPSITLGFISIGCILSAHEIMKKRNVALMMAYKTLEEVYSNYRKRVVDDYGSDTDFAYHNGLRKEKIEVEEEQENGKTKKVKKDVLVANDTNNYSLYARFFDESCTQWTKNPEYNLMLLRHQQNYFNDMLKVKGHVFLNEVYDALGIERSQAGQIVGWVAGNNHDNFIDFGIFNEASRRFVNGLERVILLDFNVDGVIYDKI